MLTGYIFKVRDGLSLPDSVIPVQDPCAVASDSAAIGALRRELIASGEAGSAPILALTPRADTARKLGLTWGVHAVQTKDIGSFEEMIAKARRMARKLHR